MKNILVALSIVLTLACCATDGNKGDQDLKDRNRSLLRENDSLKNKLAAKDTIVETAEPAKTIEPSVEVKSGKGKHPITLQWISWDKPGEVLVTPLADGWFTILGSQRNSENNDYLKIDGKIRRLGEKELEFDGIIEIQVAHNNNGEVCIKEGKQKFYAKGNRKYFRLQDMTNCEGGMLVDYVDIYPGTSSL